MHRLQEKYQKAIIPEMKKVFGYKNNLAVPRLDKVVLNIGTGPGLKDPKFNEVAESTLIRITGQRPIKTMAKKSISNFKIREGLVVGLKVTLHGNRMYDFIDKLINITLARVRDFRGVDEKSLDKNGNLNIGFKEQVAFPEIKADEVEKIHGLQVVVTTTAETKAESLTLLKLLGFPFRKD